jgi:hypothetical protein
MDSELLKRELRVAFSPRAQPIYFRIAKYVLLFTSSVVTMAHGIFGYGSAARVPEARHYISYIDSKRAAGLRRGAAGMISRQPTRTRHRRLLRTPQCKK